MSAKSRASKPRTAKPSATPPTNPPRASRWQLITSGILLALWMLFLAWIAFTGE